MSYLDKQEITTAKFVELLNGLMLAGLAVKVHGYQTHTGDPFDRPWTGAFAYEISIKGSAVPEIVTGDGIKRIIDDIAVLGFDVYLGRDDEGEQTIRLSPDRLMVRPEPKAEGTARTR